MSGRRLALALALGAALAAACSRPSGSTPISVGPAPASFWTTLGTARKLFPGEPVPVTVAPFEGKLLQGTDAEGHYWEQVGAKGEPIQLAFCREEPLPSGERVAFCVGMRPGAPTLGRARDGSVFRKLEGGKLEKVGEARREVVLPTGEGLLFTRAAGSGDPWLGAGSVDVWSCDADRKFVHAGEGRYLWATSADGTRRHLYMSRGPGAKDRWVGEQDGVIYVER
jgi:hypothetical protein